MTSRSDDIHTMGIQVLGPLSLDDHHPISRRDRVVLATLVVSRPTVVSPDRLADVLWPDGSPASSAKVLQGCVARLRVLLGAGAIVTSEHGYWLNGVEEIDAVLFEQGIARGREYLVLGQHDRAVHTLTEALTLWRGEPYLDLAHSDVATIEVARLSELRRQGEELQVDGLLGCGDHEGAAVAARGMVDAEPLRERRWLQMALAEHQAGRRAEALATLRRGRHHLREELGLDPGVEAEALERAILQRDPALLFPAASLPQSSTCPWPGLSSYDAADADCFFGREAELVSALAVLRGRPVLVVVGPSGIGKSSFVRAGVAAALTRTGRSVWITTPTSHLPQATASANVLVVDQAEELFALSSAEIEDYVEGLVAQAARGQLVLTLRADRMSDVAHHPELARLVEQGIFLLGGVEEAGLRRAIERPAALNGLHVEPGLVDLVLRDLEDEPGALPMLSHALVQTWERREGATMTVRAYQATGGIRGAVAQSAEILYAGLGADQQAGLRPLMLRLVSAGPEGEPRRARVSHAVVSAGKGQAELVEQLLSCRLVTTDDGMVTLAHEALVRAWPRLREWLDDDVEGRRILHHLTSSSQSWQDLAHPESELYRGVRLARTLEWRERSGITLSTSEQAFLTAGMRLAEDEQHTAEDRARRQARSNRRLRVLAASLGVVLVAALAAGGVALGQSDRADREAATASLRAKDAAARSLGARALLADDPVRALLLGVAGVRLGPSPDTRAALASVIARRPRLIGVAELPEGTIASTLVTGAAEPFLYATDRTRHVFQIDPQQMRVSRDHRVGHDQLDIWETALGTPGRAGGVLAVAAAQQDTPAVRLLDPTTLEEVADQLGGWPRRRVSVSSLATDAAGRFLAATMATANIESDTVGEIDSGQTMVWDLSAPRRPVVRIRTPENFFNGVALSPDASTVYVTNPLTAYDVASGEELWRSADSVFDIIITGSPDGRTLAVADDSDHAVVALVDTRTGRVLDRLRGHTEPLTGVDFSPDGTLLAASAADGRALVWDADTLELVDDIDVGIEQVKAVAFGRDRILHTLTSGPAQVQSWDLGGYRSFVERRRVLEPVVAGNGTMIRVNHGGTMAATLTSSDDTTRIGVVDAASEVALTHDVASIDTNYLGAGAWSSDDSRYATGYAGGIVQVVDVATGRELVRRRVVDDAVAEVAFSADDRHLVVAEVEGAVRRVETDTLTPAGPEVLVPEKIYAATMSPDGKSAFVAAGGTRWRPYWQEVIGQWYLVDLVGGEIVGNGDVAVDSAAYAAFSPDGRRVAIGGRGGEIAVIDVTSGQPLRPPVPVHAGAAMWLAWDAEGRYFTSGSDAGEVALFDGVSGELLGLTSVPAAHGLAVGGFRPDGTILIATSSGWVGVWDPGIEGSVEYACRVAARSLTRAEWTEVVPGQDWQSTCPG